jgi:aminoglycoside phosphotransferase (APT) family kinase protein
MKKRLETPIAKLETHAQRREAVRRIQRRRLARILARVEKLDNATREETRQRRQRQAAELVARVFAKQFSGMVPAKSETKNNRRKIQ